MLSCTINVGTDPSSRLGEAAVTLEQPAFGGGIYRDELAGNYPPPLGLVDDINIQIGAQGGVRVLDAHVVGESALEADEIEIASSYGDIQSLGSLGDLDGFDLEQGELCGPGWITVTRRKPARTTVKVEKPINPLSETDFGLVGPAAWGERAHAERKQPAKAVTKSRCEPARRRIAYGETEHLPSRAERSGIAVRGTGTRRNPKAPSQINGSNGECTGTDDLPAHADRFRSAAAETNRGSGSRSKVSGPPSPTDEGKEKARRYEDKQRPCFKFSVGTCRFGDDCKFSHEEGLDPELSKPQGYLVCRDFVKGECKRGGSCRFSHSLGKTPPEEPNAKKTADAEPPKEKPKPKVSFQSWAAGMLHDHHRGDSEEVEDDEESISSQATTDGTGSSQSSSSSGGLTPSSGTAESSDVDDESSSQDDQTVSSLATDESTLSKATVLEGPEVKVGDGFPRSMPLPDLERQFKIFGRLDKEKGTFRIPLDEAESYIMGESELGPLLAEMRQKADFIMKNDGSHKLLAILGTGWMKPGLAGLNGPAATPFFDLYEVKLSHIMLEVEWSVTQDMVLQTEDSRSANKTHVTMVAGADFGNLVVGMALLFPRACPDAPCPNIDWFSSNGRGLSRLYSSVFGLLGNFAGSDVFSAMHREREEVGSRWARAQTSYSRQPGNMHWLTSEDCPRNTHLYSIDRATVRRFGYYIFERDGLQPPVEYSKLPYIGSTWTPLLGLDTTDLDLLLSDVNISQGTDDLFWAFGCSYQRVALSFTLVHNHAHAAMTVTEPLSLRSVCASVNNNAAYNIPGNGKGLGGSHAFLSLIGCEALAKKPKSERAKWKGGAAL